MWPAVRRLGASADESEYICDECTREKYGLDDSVPVWVFVKSEPKPKPKPPSKPRAKKVKCSLCKQTGHVYTDCPLINGETLLGT